MDETETIFPWVFSTRLRDENDPVKMLTNVKDMNEQKPNLLLLSGKNQAGESYRLADVKGKYFKTRRPCAGQQLWRTSGKKHAAD